MGNNQVVRELARMSNTVRGIGQDKRRSDIDMANIGLQGKRQAYDIGRQKSQDARADELFEAGASERELNKLQSGQALETYNRPFGLASLGPNALEHAMHELKDGTLAGDQWGKVLGYTFDKDPDSPTHTQFLKDGKAVPSGSVDRRKLGAAIRAYMHPDLKARTRQETNDTNLANKKISPQQHALIRDQIYEAQQNIPKMIKENEEVVQVLSSIGTSEAMKRIGELETKNDSMAKEWRTRKAALKAASLKAKKTGLGDELKYTKEKRALINNAMKIVGNNLGFGEGWGSGMSSMNENQRSTHGNYTNLIGVMAEKGLYGGNPASLATAAIKIDGAISVEAEKRAASIEDGFFEKQGITRDQWLQQAKVQLMQDAMGQIGGQPKAQNNKFKLNPDEIKQIQDVKAGKTLSGIGGLFDKTKKGTAKPVSKMSPEERDAELKRPEAERGRSPLDLYLEHLKNVTPEEKEVGLKRKKERDKKSFLRKAPKI